jgi:hypothetical protein
VYRSRLEFNLVTGAEFEIAPYCHFETQISSFDSGEWRFGFARVALVHVKQSESGEVSFCLRGGASWLWS